MDVMFDRILSLRVSDVMTCDPITVDASASMAEVCHLFLERNLHSAPVVDESGRCVGIITASDFVQRTQLCSSCERQPRGGAETSGGNGSSVDAAWCYESVSDCMTHSVQSVSRSSSLIAAARIMTSAHFHVLPVIEDHRPVGVISNLDVVAALVNAFAEVRNHFE
jgi:CBS domain-containing protein